MNKLNLSNKTKNAVKFIAAAFAASFLLISCGKPSFNENGFCQDGETAAKLAQKNNQNILIVATMAEDEPFSGDFIENVLKSPKFNEEIATEYVVLQLDFSRKAYEATVYNEESTKEQKKIAEENAERMQQNTLLASRLNLQITPSVYIMSKDMYYITELAFDTDQITNYDSFKALLDSQQSLIEDFNTKLAATKTGTKEEKLAAIDKLFESTDVVYRAFIVDLIDDYIKMDKKDSSGLLSKYLLAKADIVSSNYFMGGDTENAVKAYIDVADDLRLAPEHRQNCYYLAAYIMALSQSTDYEAILEYLNKAVEVYPDSPNTPAIQMVIEQFTQVLEQSKAAEAAETENSEEVEE